MALNLWNGIGGTSSQPTLQPFDARPLFQQVQQVNLNSLGEPVSWVRPGQPAPVWLVGQHNTEKWESPGLRRWRYRCEMPDLSGDAASNGTLVIDI